MGTYLELTAKPGCEDQINEAYAAMTGDPSSALVYSEKIIVSEIARIRTSTAKSDQHMKKWLRTVEDWNRAFPIMRAGRGQIKLSGICDDEVDRIAEIKRDIQFILDHRMLFQCIDGLDDARDHGLCDFPLDTIEAHQAKRRPPSEDPLFEDLPRGRCEVYRLCVRYGRPDLWRAYHAFKTAPSEDTWNGLRTKVVPWHGIMTSVRERLEAFATQQDGLDYGLRGRFRDGTLPSVFQLRAALREPRKAHADAA